MIKLTVKIINVDPPSGKISASIKAQHVDPWTKGQLGSGTDCEAHVVRFVEKADRCKDGPGYLLELMPGAFAMLCADGLSLEIGQKITVTVNESDYSKRAVSVVVK